MTNLLRVDVCRNPVFIIGSPRSGTTILAKSLGEHRELWVSKESDFIFQLFGGGRATDVFERAIRRPTPSWLRAENVSQEEFLSCLGVGVNVLFTSRSDGKRWLDQTPLYTLMVDELAQMFPEAVFLHVLRDGRRVVSSMVNFLNRRGPEQRAALERARGSSWWGNDFREACRAWTTYVGKATEFGARNPGRLLAVVNEELVGHPAQGFREIFSFLGVRHEHGPSEFFRTHIVNSSFSPNRAGAAVLSEPWRDWTPEQQTIFAVEAGQTLVSSGFATEVELAARHDGARRLDGDAYWRLVASVRETVSCTTPANATVLVVSRGDDSLVALDGRDGWHFPQDATGRPAGHHPTDSAQAIGHLEELRARGAGFFVIPATERWWLDYYESFRRHLESRYRRLAGEAEGGIVYALEDSAFAGAKQ